MKIHDPYELILTAIEVEVRNQRKYGPGGDEGKIGQIRSDLIAAAVISDLGIRGDRAITIIEDGPHALTLSQP